ncbi:MAG: hypothetical protein N3D77_01895 [Geminicoccaceae bacterium]|nr:hypothetical protein [Geminicoccaceae bacterium]
MSLGNTLRIAVSGLATAQRALAVTAQNATNATTEGYVRKRHVQETLAIDGQGQGVRPLAPQRVIDEFLTAELRVQTGRLARSAAIAELMGRAEAAVFGSPGETGNGIPNRLARLSSAAESLANDPSKIPLRAALVGAAQDLAREIARAGEQVQALRRDADQRIDRLVDSINADIAALHEVNLEVSRGKPSAELEDRRDRLLQELARKLDIATYRLDDGRTAGFPRGGQPLLEGGPRGLVYTPAPVVDATTLFEPITIYSRKDIDPATGAPLPGAIGATLVTGGLRAALPPELETGTPADEALIVRSPLASGELQGLLEVRDRLLPELADRLDELARITRFALNAAHNAAVAWPPPESLTATRIEDGTFDASARAGTAWLAVVDRATGTTLQTIAIDLTADFATLVAQLDADLAGHGDASVDAEGRLAIALDPGKGIALADGDGTVTVTDALGHSWAYGFAHYFGLDDLLVAEPDRPTALSVRADLVAQPGRLATAKLDVDLGPPAVARLGGAGDNRGIQALAAAFERRVQTVARGALDPASATMGSYAADLLGLTAVEVARSNDAAEADRAMAEELESRSSAISGVNMDEELARLVLYQQSYGVAARLVQITNRMFDELMELAR